MKPNSLAFALLAIPLSLTVARTLSSSLQGSVTPSSRSLVRDEAPLSCPNSVADSSINLNDNWAVFRWLTATSNKLPTAPSPRRSIDPIWESWCTKQDIWSGGGIHNERADLRGLSDFPLPKQTNGTTKKNMLTTSDGELALVLFNQIAAEDIRTMNLGSQTERPVAFRDGAVIIKTIWRVIDPNSPPPFTFPASAIGSSDERNQTDLVTSSLTTKFDSLVNVNISPQQIDCIVNGANVLPATPISNGDRVATTTPIAVPLGCFHTHQIDALGKTEEAIQANCTAPTCIAVLTGFHVMTKTKESVQWNWMTFWFRPTGDPETSSGPAPWKFFTGNATRGSRSGPSVSGKYEICFNPYLEGTKDVPNGQVSNCLDCHRFAAYDNSLKTVEARAGKFTTGNSPAFGQPPLKTDSCPHEKCGYFDGNTISASFVWSIVEQQNSEGAPGPANP